MVNDRQRRLLALLDSLGGSVGGLDFQKLLFLYCQQIEPPVLYEFVPYRFGGFSFTSYADKRRLVERGLLEDEERSWKLTDDGRHAASMTGAVPVRMAAFAERYADLRGDALVSEAYRRFPYYAIRSEMVERLFANDQAALASVAAARPETGQPGVCTIGYEGRTLEGYLNQLIVEGVTLLCDVRRNPLSRRYGFSKKTLAHGCESVGIEYVHLPELGIASEERRGLETQADYDALFDTYEQKTLMQNGRALQRIRLWVTEGKRVALTCFERLPQQCHRRSVAVALQRRFGDRFAPAHL